MKKKLDNIFIIDDDPICSWLNKTFLEDMQVAQNVDCFSDGQSALDFFYKSCANADFAFPDLIFLDINMPGIDGFQFLEKLKTIEGCESLSSNRVVFLSTSMHQRDLERAQRYNIKGYLVKPLTQAKITEVVGLINSSEKVFVIDDGIINPTSKPLQDRLPVDKQTAGNSLESKRIIPSGE